jgi:hypothetical protein
MLIKSDQSRRFSIPMLLLWGTFHVIFMFLLNLRESKYFSRILGVETVNLSPLSVFYTSPNVHNFVTKISLRELYNRMLYQPLKSIQCRNGVYLLSMQAYVGKPVYY